jgi:hypothetical protein
LAAYGIADLNLDYRQLNWSLEFLPAYSQLFFGLTINVVKVINADGRFDI